MRAVKAIIEARQAIHPLRLIRIGRNLSRSDLERETGVARGTIYQIEERTRVPYVTTRYLLLDFLGIDRQDHLSIFGPRLARGGNQHGAHIKKMRGAA